MPHAARTFVDGPYGQMHLRVSGTRTDNQTPLVCLHMFPQSSRNFTTLLPLLGEERFTIAPDFPGYGESAGPDDPISAPEYAAAIWQAIDNLDPELKSQKIDLFGIHAGAKLAVNFAHQNPDRVRRIILCSAAVLYKEELDNLKSIFSPIALDEEGTRFKHLWNLLLNNRGANVSYEMLAESFAEMLRGGEAYEWGHQAVFEYNSIFPDELQALTHDVLLLNPNDDLYQMTSRTAPFLQNGILVDRPQWSHGFLKLDALDVAADISLFLREGITAFSQSETLTA